MEDIAIIAASFQLPGIAHAGDLWNSLSKATINYKQVDADFWQRRCGDTRAYKTVAGCIESIERFNPEYFGILPREAFTLDPQQRLTLIGVRNLLESVGFQKRYQDTRDVGVFLGASGSEYRQRFLGESANESLYATTGTANSIIAGRVSYQYNFSGPSLVIDTACSSSLAAVALATASLQRKECQFAIAGGINLLITTRTNNEYLAMGMTSPSGLNSTFAENADGYVRGEGYGFILLRPLKDAVRDGDTVLGVIASAVTNQDGTTNGITAPNGQSQTSLIKQSLALAGLEPGELHYNECHGTGTKLGDLIELRALASIFGTSERLAIGSIKANIGHLEVAAGIAGVVKALIMLRTKQVPPHPWASHRTTRFEWKTDSGLALPSGRESLDSNESGISNIGISSFGFGGTNCHIIIKSHHADKNEMSSIKTRSTSDNFLSIISGPTRNELTEYRQSIHSYVNSVPNTSNSEVVHSLKTLRETMSCVGSVELTASNNRVGVKDLKPLNRSLINNSVFLFGGQGSYKPGIGSKLWHESGAAAKHIDTCLEILQSLDYPYADILRRIFTKESSGGMEELSTAPQQLLIAITEYAIGKTLIEAGIQPSYVLGHSLGEYIAAVIAGKLSIKTALYILTKRSLLIEREGVLGTLLAINSSEEAIKEIATKHGCEIALCNSDTSVVVGGSTHSIESLSKELDQEISQHKLNLTIAYHTKYASRIAESIRNFHFETATNRADCRFISCLTGDEYAGQTDSAYWASQIESPVLLGKALVNTFKSKPSCIIEISPKCILSKHIAAACTDCEIPIFTAEEMEAEKSSTVLTRVIDQMLEAGFLDPIQMEANNDCLQQSTAYDPLVPVCTLGGDVYWYESGSKSTELDKEKPSETKSSAISSKMSPDEASEDIGLHLAKTFAKICGIQESKIEGSKSFQRYGADSLLLSQFAAKLTSMFGTTISVPQLFGDLNNIDRLTNHLNEIVAERPRRGQEDRKKTGLAEVRTISKPIMPSTSANNKKEEQHAPQGIVKGKQLKKQVSSTAYQNYIDGLRQRLGKQLTESKLIRTQGAMSLADTRAIAGYDPDLREFQFPVVGSSADKAYITDVDGNTYIDLTMGFGVQLFGHRAPFIEAAIRQQLNEGLHLGPQAKRAASVAKLITEVTGHERVAFCNTGTEAVMTALRLARAKTGRNLVAQFSGAYHGHFDPTLCLGDGKGESHPLSPGTPISFTENTLLLDYADPEKSIEILEQHKDVLAAVLVEPIQSRNPGLQPVELLRNIQKLCTEKNIILIFDEVLSGFRVSQSGVQGILQIKPELTCYGKIAGGGLPIGIVAGSAESMAFLDRGSWVPGLTEPDLSIDSIFFAGTFNKNPLTMAASEAVMLHLKAHGGSIQRELNELTKRWVTLLNNEIAGICVGARIDYFSSFFRFIGFPAIFYYALLEKGVYIWEGRTCFLSSAHTTEDLERVQQSILEVVTNLVDVGALEGTAVDSDKINKTQEENEITYPLTAAQRETLTAHLLLGESASKYNQTICINVDSTVDIGSLLSSITNATRRALELNTVYNLIHEEGTYKAPLLPTIHHCTSVQEIIEKPFNPDSGINIRIGLLSSKEAVSEITKVVLVFPHFSVDGWSLQVLANLISQDYSKKARLSYSGESKAPSANLLSYGDYVKWIKKTTDEEVSHQFWIDFLSGFSNKIGFSRQVTEHLPTKAAITAGVIRTRLPELTTQAVTSRASSIGVAAFHIYLSCFVQTIKQISGQEDLTIATLSAGQLLSGMHELVGNCTTVLPLRFHSKDLNTDCILNCYKIFQKVLPHWNFDARKLVKDLGVRPNSVGHALSNVCFNYDKLTRIDPLFRKRISFNPGFDHESKWDLFLNIVSDDERIEIELEYNRQLFSDAQAKSVLSLYTELLSQALSTSEEEQIPHVTVLQRPHESEKGIRIGHLLINPGTSGWLLTAIQNHGEKYPSRIALESEGLCLKYGKLWETIQHIAKQLESRCERTSKIAILTEDTAQAVLLTLACWAAGKIPFQLAYQVPTEWLNERLKQSGCQWVLGKSLGDKDQTIIEFEKITVSLTRTSGSEVREDSKIEEENSIRIGYLLATSGSTGAPKIVAISHDSLRHYVEALLERIQLPNGENECLTFGVATPLSSDLGYTSIFPALYLGHSLHCLSYAESRDGELCSQRLAKHPVDFLKIVPSHLSALLSSGLDAELLPKQYLVFGGDFLSRQFYREIRGVSPKLRIFNHYGPSEATVGVCAIELTDTVMEDSLESIPVGKPLKGIHISIKACSEEELNQPSGEQIGEGVGEVVISGPTVMLGYLAGLDDGERARSTAFETTSEVATGDLGYVDKSGRLHIVSRKSSLIKVNGYRVSIPYLEQQISTLDLVNEAVIVPVTVSDDPNEISLACLIDCQDIAAIERLKKRLYDLLPSYYQPKKFQVISALPRLSNGKIDRRECLNLAAKAWRTTAKTPILSEERNKDRSTETLKSEFTWSNFIQMVGKIVNIDDTVIDKDSNFIQLGGDSIDAIRLMSILRERDVRISAIKILESNTLVDLFESIISNQCQKQVFRGTPLPPNSNTLCLTPSQRSFLRSQQPDPDQWSMTSLVRFNETLSNSEVSKRIKEIVRESASLQYSLVDDCLVLSNKASQLSYEPLEELQVSNIDKFALPGSRIAIDATSKLLNQLSLTDSCYISWSKVRVADEEQNRTTILLCLHHFFFDAISLGKFIHAISRPTVTRELVSKANDLQSIFASIYTSQNSSKQRFEAYLRYLGNAFYRQKGWPETSLQENYLIESSTLMIPAVKPKEAHTRFGYLPLLLLSLEKSILDHFDQRKVAIDIETHGRPLGSTDIDTTGIFSYFTCHTPLILNNEGCLTTRDRAQQYIEALGRLSDEAINYNNILHQDSETIKYHKPGISFNYISSAGQENASDYSVLAYDIGQSSSAKHKRDYPLQFIVFNRVSSLSVRVEFDHTIISNAEVQAILASMKSQWISLIQGLANCNSNSGEDQLIGLSDSDDNADEILLRLFS